MKSFKGFMFLAVTFSATAASAQGVGSLRGFVSLNAGMQPSPITFSEPTSDTVYLEKTALTSDYRIPSGMLFDVGGGFRIKGGLGVGIAISSFNKHDAANISGTIPHPFFYNKPRSISGEDGSGARQELNTHIQALWFVPTNGRVDVVLAGGPTLFSVKQDVVTKVSFSESYPYDTAAFSTATMTKINTSRVGFNVGVDVGVRLARNVGVGGVVRYSHAAIDLPVSNATGNTKSDAGGAQVGAGLRLFF